MTFTSGQRVRINGGAKHGELAIYVRLGSGVMENGLHIVRQHGMVDFAVASVLPATANNGD